MVIVIRYLIGGYNGSRLNDVWKSSDMVNWSCVNKDAPFKGRQAHSLLSQENQLYIIGGQDNDYNCLKDVWQSEDGKNWSLVLGDGLSPFGGRGGHTVTVFNGYMWLCGGYGQAANNSV